MNKNIIIGLLVALVIIIGGYSIFSGGEGKGASTGPAFWGTASFLQGLNAGTRDQFSVSNAGVVNMVESNEVVSADNTLTAIEANKTTYISTTGATYTLPAVSTAGLVYRFYVSTLFTTNAVIDSAEGDNIEGALIVAGAVVDCSAEDQINFVADGENLGDFVELRSDGTSWLISASGALTAAKLTCTDPS